MRAVNLATPAENSGASLLTRLPLRRVLAIDAFRGLTILLMIFVNTLAGVRGMPAWLRHTPAHGDGMTFPDVIFPAFLFIVGMSIPFATMQRLAAGDTSWQLGRHVLARTLGLLVLGVFMVNAEEGYNEQAMPMSIGLWSLMFYGAAILVWSVYRFRNKTPEAALRLAGVAVLVALGLLFRGGADGSKWLAPQWWGILGLIGWAYLFASTMFLLARGRILPLVAALLACVIYYCLAHLHAVQSSTALKLLAQTDNAVDTSIALCGVMTSLIFFNASGEGAPQRFGAALLLVLALLAIGALLQPYYGISKIDAAPSWALYSAAICMALFGFLYWLIDLQGAQSWTAFLHPAAANPLLAYIIPGIVYALMQSLHVALPASLTEGMTGLVWSGAYAAAVLALVAGLNRLHIKLRL